MSLPHHKRKATTTKKEEEETQKKVCIGGEASTAEIIKLLAGLRESTDDLRRLLYEAMYGDDSTEVDEEDPAR